MGYVLSKRGGVKVLSTNFKPHIFIIRKEAERKLKESLLNKKFVLAEHVAKRSDVPASKALTLKDLLG